jgi:hypothetical protein
MNALAVLTGTPTQAALDKASTARATAERRITELTAERDAALRGTGDVAAIDRIDGDIAAERRKIAIIEQKIEALSADLRTQARKEREVRRIDAIKKIGSHLRARKAIAQEIEKTLAHLAELYDKLNDHREIRQAFPFAEFLPSYFSWHCGALQWETMRTLAHSCWDMLPGEVRDVIAASHAGDGVTRAVAAPIATGVTEVYAAHAAHVLNTLAKVNIHPPGEDDADNEEAA